MLIRGAEVPEQQLRKPYPVAGQQEILQHFAVRVTTPANPFPVHRHEKAELWYIVDGEAIVTVGGEEHAVEGGDLVILAPWVEHGLRTEGRATWICLG
jgi:mannose-6-phosphate isomerase-like protein (cupin superfamily)